jgi:putative oxidoreductase
MIRSILSNHEIIAVFIVRVFLGMLFFFQGYDAIFRVGLKNITDNYYPTLERTGVSRSVTAWGVVFSFYVQLIGGFLLILGFIKYYALCLLGINMVFTALVFGVTQPMWDLRAAFPRLVLLVFLLFVPWQWDVFSVDYFWSFFRFLRSF